MARIAAPVVFLVAVIALVSIVVQSGVIGGDDQRRASVADRPSRVPSRGEPTQAAAKRYVIKSGDTLSGIAAKFDITVSDILELNPDLSGSTLSVGEKVKIPTQ